MDRRKAIAVGGLTALLPIIGHSELPKESSGETENLKIGMAGYSFAHYKGNLDKLIQVMQDVGVRHTTLKDFHLPYQSTKDQAAMILGKLRNAGIEPYGLGVIYMEKPEDVDVFFNYALTAGISLIICSPEKKLLPLIEEKVRATGIRVAIHNHGPEDGRYPDIDSIYTLINNLDDRIGICLDVGHSYRCGNDPAVMLEKFGHRVIDLHIKDITEPIKNGVSTIPGRGSINLKKFFSVAAKIKFEGFCSLEYERPGDPALGIAESIGYLRGLIRGLSGKI